MFILDGGYRLKNQQEKPSLQMINNNIDNNCWFLSI